MKEDLFFQIMDGMQEKHIAEAAEWKYCKKEESENEISALFERELYAPASAAVPEEPASAADDSPVIAAEPVQTQPQSRMIRITAVSLAAIAAVIAVTVGLLTLYAGREQVDTYNPQPGMSGLSVQSTPEETALAETDAAAANTANTADTTTVQSETVPAAGGSVGQLTEDPHAAAAQIISGGENCFGGEGALRPVAELNSSSHYFEDDKWYYELGYSPGFSWQMLYRYNKYQTDKNGAHVCEVVYAPEDENAQDIVPRLISGGDQVFAQQEDADGCLMLFEGNQGYSSFLPNDRIRQDLDLTFDTLSYYRIAKLGDTGSYYLYACTDSSPETGRPVKRLNMIYTPETHQLIFLPEELKLIGNIMYYDAEHNWMYLGSSPQIYLMDQASVTDDGVVFTNSDERAPAVYRINAATGEVLAKHEIDTTDRYYRGNIWAICNGKLYYLANDADRMNGMIGLEHLCEYSFDTGERKMLEERTGIEKLCAIGGKLYLLIHDSVSDDQISMYDPGSGERWVLKTGRELSDLDYNGTDDYFSVPFQTQCQMLYSPEKGWLLLAYASEED